MTKKKSITIDNAEISLITQGHEDYISLTDMAGRYGRTAKRELSKINYHIHTDAICENLMPKEPTSMQASIVYASAADVLNVAMFGMTAKEWRESHSGMKGNIRDYATINELICLSNMLKLNQIAIQQMRVLENTGNRKSIK